MRDFQIKVCGITRVEDALAAVAAGADAIGLNLSVTSKRRVSVPTAQTIVDQVRQVAPKAKCVGVFVEQAAEEVEALAQQIGLDVIQLHGDQAVSVLGRTWSRPVLWVARVPMSAGPEMANRLSTVAEAVVANSNWTPNWTPNSNWTLGVAGPPDSGRLAGILVDAYAAGDYGGTGRTVAWEPLGQRDSWQNLGWASKPWPAGLPLILAGGLNAANVAAAIQQSRPTAVDVASGVETQPGVKSLEQMIAFISAARQSLSDSTPP